MYQAAATSFRETEKPELYRELGLQLSGLFHGERNMIANAANMSALIADMLPDLTSIGSGSSLRHTYCAKSKATQKNR